jgi:hypothetical protein
MKIQLPVARVAGDDLNLLAPDADQLDSGGMARSRSGTNLFAPPGLLAPQGAPSHGSVLHGTGNCRPCAWFWKAGGCQNGQECGHCHLCPEGEIKNRKKNKLTMMRNGLATPKTNNTAALTSFGFDFGLGEPSSPSPAFGEKVVASPVEQESTTCSLSDQGSMTSSRSKDILSQSPCAGSSATASDSEYEQEGTDRLLAAPPGLQAPSKTVSQGSVLHGEGNCRPCAWFWKPTGCKNGRDCTYCHSCSDGELKSRKKNKQTAIRLGFASPSKDGNLY